MPDERAHRPPGLADGRGRARWDRRRADRARRRRQCGARDPAMDQRRPPARTCAVPEEHCAIVNAHFRLAAPPRLADGIPLLALVGATAQWLIVRGDVVSVTVSAADSLIDRDADATLRQLWHETAQGAAPAGADARGAPRSRRSAPRSGRRPPQSGCGRRPTPRCSNLFLAGDWTATGLPATIEGAVRSGHAAAAAGARIESREQDGRSIAATRFRGMITAWEPHPGFAGAVPGRSKGER